MKFRPCQPPTWYGGTPKVHPFAADVPRPSRQEETDIWADIRENGLYEAITIYQDAILDGLTRYEGCRAGSREPRFEELIGTDDETAKFVFGKAVLKRHLSEGQKADLWAGIAACLAQRVHMSEEACRQVLAPRMPTARRYIECEVDPDLRAEVKSRRRSYQWALVEQDRRTAQQDASSRAAHDPLPDGFEIIEADALDFLPTMAPSSFDVVFTDPDFDRLDHFEKTAMHAARLLVPSGVLVLYVPLLTRHKIIDAARRYGFEPKWEWTIRRKEGRARRFDSVGFPRYYTVTDKVLVLATGPQPRIYMNTTADEIDEGDDVDTLLHPFAKSTVNAEYILSRLCPSSGKVLDPFCGSGTVLVAARRLGMRAVGIELERRYA
ncbi:hypothetical protein LCGC14_2614310, partial [marine sediment metagenome]